MTHTIEQAEAVYSDAPRLVITACPGSGKTTTLAARINHYLETGDRGIAVVTYTNAAANHIRSRLHDGQRGAIVHCGTLHSLMFKIITIEHEARNLLPPTILPEAGKDILMAAIKEKHRVKCSDKAIEQAYAVFSFAGIPSHRRLDAAELVVAGYFRQMAVDGFFDYDAILRDGFRLITEGCAATKAFIASINHLFVDEFQDAAMVDLATYNSWPAKTVTMVGDPQQCIFGFRGADTQNVFKQTQRPGWKHLKLTTNFRSDARIILNANALIAANGPADPMQGREGVGEGHTSSMFVESQEAGRQLAVSLIRKAVVGAEAVSHAECAIILRTNAAVYAYRQTLEAEGIPVAIPHKSPVKAMDSLKLFLAFVQRPTDLFARLLAENLSDALAQTLIPMQLIPPRAHALPLMSLVKTAIGFGLPCEAIEFMSAHPEMLAGEALAYLRGEQTEMDGTGTAGVNVLTAHAAKGREFDFVIVSELSETVWPMGDRAGSVPEERRLAYVAYTRARKSLVAISVARIVPSWGGKPLVCAPSRFIGEAGL